MLATAGVFTATAYFQDTGFLGILAVFATILAVLRRSAIAGWMRAFPILIVCHKTGPAFSLTLI